MAVLKKGVIRGKMVGLVRLIWPWKQGANSIAGLGGAFDPTGRWSRSQRERRGLQGDIFLPAGTAQLKRYDEIYQIHHDNTYIFNIAEKVNYALITNAKMDNVQTTGQAIGANNSGEQMFFIE